MSNLADKCQKDTENKITFICNRKLWQDIQKVLGNYLADFKTDGTYMYSMAKNQGEGGYVKVGATFNTYEYAGKLIAA